MVVDSEVDEIAASDVANFWLLEGDGTVLRSWSTEAFSVEPADITVRGRRLYICDDDHDSVFIVRRGDDHRFGTVDDRVASFPTDAFGARDPEGIAYADGALYIADGANGGAAAIFRVDPGPNARFEGNRDSDDVIERMALDAAVNEPEGLAAWGGSLFVASRSGAERTIVQLTFAGEVVQTLDIAATGINRPAGIAVVPRVDGLLEAFVADRNVDNAVDGGENDGRVYHLLFN
jgi:hypothetical protein